MAKQTKSVHEFLLDAINAQKEGNIEYALNIYNGIENAGYSDGNLYNLKALALRSKGDFDQALHYARLAADSTNHENAYFLNTLGLTLKDHSDFESAIQIFKKSIGLVKSAETINNLANCYFDLETYSEAAKLYQSAITIDERLSQPYENLSTIFVRRNNFQAANKILTAAAKRGVVSQKIFKNKINLAIKEDKLDLARTYLVQEEELYGPTGQNIHNKIKVYSAAEEHDRLAQVLDGLVWEDQPALVLAAIAYGFEVLESPEMCQQVISYCENKRWEEFSDEQKSIVKWNKALSLLRLGRAEDAWEGYVHRFGWSDFPSEHRVFKVPKLEKIYRAKGKTVLLWREQGLGDEILFLNLVKSFIHRAKCQVIIETCNKFCSLVTRSFPDCVVRPASFDPDTFESTNADFDYHIPFGDLAPLLNFSEKKPDLVTPYIKADSALVKKYQNNLPTDKKIIGFSWRSGNMARARERHYTSLIDWAPLLKRDDVCVLNLQYDDISNDIAMLEDSLRKKLKILDIDFRDDLEAVSAIMENCDLVISPYNAVLMQAASMGIKTIAYGVHDAPLSLGVQVGQVTYEYPWFKKNISFNMKEISISKMIEETLKLLD